ncbi:MAG: hypothetical protein HRU10_08660 [Opitutales bacterium]|nr:hypothetical protein [Opitutales bacterium]
MRIDWNDRPSNRPPAATKHRPPAVFVVAIVVVGVVDGISTTITTTTTIPTSIQIEDASRPERPNHDKGTDG